MEPHGNRTLSNSLEPTETHLTVGISELDICFSNSATPKLVHTGVSATSKPMHTGAGVTSVLSSSHFSLSSFAPLMYVSVVQAAEYLSCFCWAPELSRNGGPPTAYPGAIAGFLSHAHVGLLPT